MASYLHSRRLGKAYIPPLRVYPAPKAQRFSLNINCPPRVGSLANAGFIDLCHA